MTNLKTTDLTERQVQQALFALDTMADEWAESTNLRAMMRSTCDSDATADKLVALMKQAWVEGAYSGRISQFIDPPQNSAVEPLDAATKAALYQDRESQYLPGCSDEAEKP